MTKLKNFLKNIYQNKVRYSGFFAAILYFMDDLFNISEKCNLTPGWHLTVVATLFVIIGYAIHDRDIKSTNIIEDIAEEKKELYIKNGQENTPINSNKDEEELDNEKNTE